MGLRPAKSHEKLDARAKQNRERKVSEWDVTFARG
jgi:hypothetical protein